MTPSDVAVVFPGEPSRIVRGEPDRAGQEHAARLHRLRRLTRPLGLGALGVAAVAFVVAPMHPLSVVAYVVGALGLLASITMLHGLGARIRYAEERVGLPVPADAVEDVLETHRQLGYLGEEIAYWRGRPGASDLRSRLDEEIDVFQAAVRDLRTTWLRGDDEGWRLVAQRVAARWDGLDDLSVAVSLLAGRGPF